MQNIHTQNQTSDKSDIHGLTLVPPDVIARSGSETVAVFAELHVLVFQNARNDQFTVGCLDFLEWVDDHMDSLTIGSFVEDNIRAHLEALSQAGCSESGLLARLCAIDIFLTKCAEHLPRLRQLVRRNYGRPCPPLLLVESSSDDKDFLAVYSDFLIQHTNPRTREAYTNGLGRFFDWVASDTSGARLKDVQELRGSHAAAFIASVSETDDMTGLIDDKPRTVGTIFSAVRTYLDACIAAGLLNKNVTRAIRLPKVPSGKGATPIVENALVARMIDMIPMETEADYRDRAMIAIMAYSLFRISAVCRMRVSDYQMRGNIRYLTTIEKRTKVHEMPVHDVLAHYIGVIRTFV